MLGDGSTQGSPVSGEAPAPPPALAGHHLEVEVEPPLLAEERRQLAHRHAVADGQVVHAAEALEPGAQRRPLHLPAADRVGPVEHHEAQPGLGRGLHAEHHGGLVGVVAGAHVLDVEDQRVEPLELGAPRAQRLGRRPVQGVNREPGDPIPLVAHVASGTTSRATRIIHGGLRYLQYAELNLVRESLRERERLLRERPHLVRPIRFVLALNGQRQHSALQIRAGLWLYEKMAGPRLKLDHVKADLREFETHLDKGRKWSLFEYDDAQCEFPERLVAEWLSEAAKAGAALRNYCRVLDILQTNGTMTGAVYRDRLTDEESTVECKWVVNATGPWIDRCVPWPAWPVAGPWWAAFAVDISSCPDFPERRRQPFIRRQTMTARCS